MEVVANKEVLDPQGHIKLSVTDFAKSQCFYRELFDQLGYTPIANSELSVAWVTPNGLGIWIAPVEVTDYPYRHGAAGLHHLCVKATSTEQVDAIHSFIVAKDMVILASPKRYPEYTADYYAVFFADPDGLKLEVAYY